MRWFRLYAALLNNRKFQQLSESLRARLLNLWCLAAEGDGVLPALDGIAFGLRLSEAEAEDTLRQLRKAGFIEDGERGLMPHDWDSHQYVSDSSTGRVKLYREKKKQDSSNGGTAKKRNGNVSVTPSEQSRAETEQRTPPLPPRSARGSRRSSGAAGIGLNTTVTDWGDVDLAAEAELKRKLTEGAPGSLDIETPDSVGVTEGVGGVYHAGEFAWPPVESDEGATHTRAQYASVGTQD